VVNDVSLALECVNLVNVGRIVHVSEMRVASLFRVEARYKQTPAAT
jgi:hypothetical protein